jgi:hypothetical protein
VPAIVIGDRVQIKAQTGRGKIAPGPGVVVALIPAGTTPAGETIALYYGVSLHDPRMRVLTGSLSLDRYIVKRDDDSGYLVIPGEEAFFMMCSMMGSPPLSGEP